MSDGLQALSAQMRPVDALSSAGLGQLAGLVVPLQGVLDRLAGNASAVHSFVDAWTSVSQRIAQIQQLFGQSVATGTAEWRGASADKYRQRADDFAKSLAQFAATAAAASKTAKSTAEAVAAGRSAANDLISDLVQRLISLVRQLMAAEGGMTPTVLAQAGQLVNSFAKPVAAVERQVGATVSNTAKPLGELLSTVNAIARLWESYSGKSGPAAPRTRGTTSLSSVRVHPGAEPKSDIHFADKNKSEPLIAHEAAHVAQQRAGNNQGNQRSEQPKKQTTKTRGLVAHDLAHPAQQTPAPPPSDGPQRPRTRGLLAHELAHPVQQSSGPAPKETRGLAAHDVAHPAQQTPASPSSDSPQRPASSGLLAHDLAHTGQQASGPMSDESVRPASRGLLAHDVAHPAQQTLPSSQADESVRPGTHGLAAEAFADQASGLSSWDEPQRGTPDLLAHELAHPVQQSSGSLVGETRGVAAHDVAHPGEQSPAPVPSDEVQRPGARGMVAQDGAYSGEGDPVPFASGEQEGRELLGHEIAHPVQQRQINL